MKSRFKIGDVEYLMSKLHYDILSINCTLEFFKSKSEVFIKEYKENKKIEVDGPMIEWGEEETNAFFDYKHIDESILEQFICEMLCVQIHSSLESFLYGICELEFDEKTIKKLVKDYEKGTFDGYLHIIYNNIISMDHKNMCNKLKNWKTIRNSIVHTQSTLEKYRLKFVSGIVEIDNTCAPVEYSFGIYIENIKDYLVLIENYTKSIYKELYVSMNGKS